MLWELYIFAKCRKRNTKIIWELYIVGKTISFFSKSVIFMANKIFWNTEIICNKQDFFCPIWANLVKVIRKFLLLIEVDNYINSNMLNSKVTFAFSDLGRKCPFRTVLVQKLKIVCLQWKLVPTLIQIYWNRW